MGFLGIGSGERAAALRGAGAGSVLADFLTLGRRRKAVGDGDAARAFQH
jgi:hypothetical protein